MTTTEPSIEPAADRDPATETGWKITPYLAVAGARDALAWYRDALGARRRGDPIVMPDGRIGHAEMEIGGAVLMLSDQYPEIGVVAPAPEGVAVGIHLTVGDVDAVMARAVDAGARLEQAPADHDYGRHGVIRDPFGHRWMIHAELAAILAQPHHGDVGYASLWVPDVERAAVFFASVLGWHYAPGTEGRSRQVEGLSLRHGIWTHRRPTLFLCFAVDDVAEAVERVRAAGGEAADPHAEPYGRISDCTDDQGVAFALYQPPGGTSSRSRSQRAAWPEGDLAYITMEVVDSARTRAFYGSVLGWQFTAGRVPDGWQIGSEISPLGGISGGHTEATTVPMYAVDDIEAAVARVRAAGGTAGNPEPQPYGTSSTCVDDQGTRFYLGQL